MVTQAEIDIVINAKNMATAELTKLKSSLGTVSKDAASASSAMQSATSTGGGFAGTLKNIATQAAGFGVATVAVKGIGAAFGGVKSALFDFNAGMETATVGFTTMLGSAEKAKSFLGGLQQFAKSTPFEFPELVDSAKRMLAMGTSADQVIPRLTAIGDAAAALGGGKETINGVVTALGQMGAKGKVSAEEMNQLTERGIPAWQFLADAIGQDIPTAMKMAEKGAISADTAIGAITEGMNQKFGGMMEKQSKTFSGAMSNIKDSVGQAMGTAFKPLFDLVSQGANQFATFLSGEKFAAWSASATAALTVVIAAVSDFLPRLMQIGQTVVAMLIPAFEKIASFITGTVVPAFRDFVSGDVLPKVEAFAAVLTDQVIPAVQQLASVVGDILGPALQKGLGFLADHKEILAAAAVVIGGVLVVAFAAWAVAAGAAAIATIAAAAPVIALGLALTALVAGIIWVVKNWDMITQKFPIAGAIVDEVVVSFRHLAEWLQKAGQAIVDANFGEKIQDAFNWLVNFNLAEKAATWFGGLWTGIQEKWDEGVSFLTNLGTSIFDAIGDVTGTLVQKGKDLITGLAKGYVDLWTTEVLFFVNLGQKAFDAIADVASTLWQKGQDLIAGLYRGVKELWEREVAFFTSLGSTVFNAIGAVVDTLWQKGQDLIAGLKRGWAELWDREVTFWTGLGTTILNAVGSLASTLFNAGWDLITGMINGVKSIGQDLISTVRGFVQGAIDAAWEVIKPGSPSREGHAMMVNLFEGMISGASEMGGALRDKVMSIVKEAISSAGSAARDAAGGIAGAIGGAVSGIAGAVGGLGGGGSGNVDAWLQEAMRITGVDASWLEPLKWLVAHESGGNPNAVNPTAVIRGGVNYGHATGLLQTIPSTFAANNVTGGSITDPVANAAAAITYIKKTYGHPSVAVSRHAAQGGYAEGGTVKSGWGVVGEKGWERFHLGPQGLTIFPHEMSKAMGPMTAMAGYAGGAGIDNTKAEKFAAAVAGPGGWTPELAAAWFEGMNQIANAMQEETDEFQKILAAMEHAKFSDELARFEAWVKDFGENWLKVILETQGVQAAFQAFHGRGSASMAMVGAGAINNPDAVVQRLDAVIVAIESMADRPVYVSPAEVGRAARDYETEYYRSRH